MRRTQPTTDDCLLTTVLSYTGQRNYSTINLIDYGARWYSSALGRFTQPDSIIPDLTNTQAWNRMSYVNNNPVRYNDPTGHMVDTAGSYSHGYGQTNPRLRTDSGDRVPSLSVDQNPGGELCENCYTPISSMPDAMDRNLLDWVPFFGTARGFVRGSQNMDWASNQPGWDEEQQAIIDWNQCMGACHDENLDYDLDIALSGPPETPLTNVYGDGLLEFATSAVELGFVLKGPRVPVKEGVAVAPWGNRVRPFNNSPTKWYKGITSNLPHVHMKFPNSWASDWFKPGFGHHRPADDIINVVITAIKKVVGQ